MRSPAPIAVRLDRVSFTYAEQTRPALHEVSLTVHRGEMVVVMGATGAGKTTLAKTINRTVPTFQHGTLTGTVTVLGRLLATESVAQLAGLVGLVSQDFEAQLFSTNVVQEIAFGMEQLGVPPTEMRRRVPAALAAVGLTGFERRDPTTLSGGEKQRLAIAATLALQPNILVFDEPTTDLDPIGKLEIFAVLGRMRKDGMTMLVIEHESAAAEDADRLVVLHEGRVVADDTPARLLPQVDFLRAHGVRPPDLHSVATALRLEPVPRSIDDAEAALRRRHPSNPPQTATPVAAAAPPHGHPAPIVEARDLTLAYEAGTRALDGVSLAIFPGELVALIGQNGSGKTTLAKTLNGLLRPDTGTVRLGDRNLHELPLQQVAADIGYVFQNPDHQLFAPTVLDEVAFGPRNLGVTEEELEDRVQTALAAVGLLGCEGEDPFLLGKGQRERLAVASLLAMRPRLLILDEPTTGLDYTEQVRMLDLIAALHRGGMAILMITHSPWVVAEYAERGVLMQSGRIRFDGPLRNLFAEEDLLAASHFRVPDATRLGRRFGFTPLSVAELVAALAGPPGER
ncbi:energy-coupling factor transporter ATPase [Candidatus Binatia bacterium]|nr:energy-coupling factor transporter ATPase [Candidatus Binatia bacterium]